MTSASFRGEAGVEVVCTLRIHGSEAILRYATAATSRTDCASGNVGFSPKFNVDVSQMFEAMSRALAERGQ